MENEFNNKTEKTNSSEQILNNCRRNQKILIVSFLFSLLIIGFSSFFLIASHIRSELEKTGVITKENSERKVVLEFVGDLLITDKTIDLELTIKNNGFVKTTITALHFKNIGQNILDEQIVLESKSVQKIILSEKIIPFLLKKNTLIASLSNGEKQELNILNNIHADISAKLYDFANKNKERIIWSLIEDLTRDLNRLDSSDVKLFFSSVNILCNDLNKIKSNFKDKLEYSKNKKELELTKFYSELIHVINTRVSQCAQLNSLMIADIINWQNTDKDSYFQKYELPTNSEKIVVNNITYEINPLREIEELNDIFTNFHLLWKNRGNRTFVQIYNITLLNRESEEEPSKVAPKRNSSKGKKDVQKNKIRI